MRRVKPSTPETGTCSGIRQNYQTMERFLQFKEASPLNTTDLGVYISGQLETDIRNQGTPQEQAQMQARLNEFLAKLRLSEQSVADYTKCVQQDIIKKQQYSSQIYSLQKEVEENQKELESLEQTAKEAKERAKLLEDPYTKTTRWETWFPLGRPLEQNSLPVLLSIAILSLVRSLGMFLRLASIDLKLHWFDSGVGYLSGYGIGR